MITSTDTCAVSVDSKEGHGGCDRCAGGVPEDRERITAVRASVAAPSIRPCRAGTVPRRGTRAPVSCMLSILSPATPT